jgi:hypothetical protein
MTQQTAELLVTAVRNGSGKKFDHWEMSVGGVACDPPSCTVSVAKGNNALIHIAISDPNAPGGTNPVVFSSSPLSVPPTNPPEITDLSGQGTTKLTFKDHNLSQGTLKYVLNFDNAPPIDPIIQNGGGGPGFTTRPGSTFLPRTTTAFVIDLAIAFVVGAIIALVVRRLAR